MAFVPVANTVMVEAVFEYAGQVVENTYYFEKTGTPAPDETSISALLAAIRTVIQTDLMPTLSTAISLVRLVGTLLTAIDSISLTLTVSPPFAGSIVGDAMPNNVSYCISFLTAQRGRSFRGRNYIAGFGEVSIAGNNIVAGTRTALLAFYNELQAVGVAEGWDMVVVSRFSGGVERTAGVTTPITDFTTFDNVVDSQRRRLPGRGR